jgi:hypothetical protein
MQRRPHELLIGRLCRDVRANCSALGALVASVGKDLGLQGMPQCVALTTGHRVNHPRLGIDIDVGLHAALGLPQPQLPAVCADLP